MMDEESARAVLETLTRAAERESTAVLSADDCAVAELTSEVLVPLHVSCTAMGEKRAPLPLVWISMQPAFDQWYNAAILLFFTLSFDFHTCLL